MTHRRQQIIALGLFWAVAFTLPADAAPRSVGPQPFGTVESDVRPTDDVSRILLEGRDAASYEGMAEQLSALGATLLPTLFVVLRDRRIAVRIGERGNSTRVLSGNQESAVLDAFGRLPDGEVLAFLEERARANDSGPVEREVVTALRISGEAAGHGDLARVVALGTPRSEDGRVTRAVRGAFEDAVGRFVERLEIDPSDVRSTFRRAHPAFLAPMTAALGRFPSTANLALLAGLLGELPEVDVLLLIEVGRMGAALPHPLPSDAADAVRRYLWDVDVQLLVEATLAARALEDVEAIPSLIDLLEHSVPNVRSKALATLREITTLQMPLDSVRWRAWHASALGWWEADAPREFLAVASGTPSEASKVVLELSKKRVFRHKLTAPLAAGLERPETDLVVVTCAALGHLGSRTAIPHLTRSLRRPETDVRSAAWRALQRITGLDFGPDPDLWKLVR